MKIEVDVIAAEQSWNFDTRRQQHFLVLEIFGVRTRVPCSEDELVRAIVQSEGHVMPPAGEEDLPFDDVPQDVPAPTPKTFVQEQVSFDTATGGPFADIGAAFRSEQPALAAPNANGDALPRRLPPLKRRGDDVGIAQG